MSRRFLFLIIILVMLSACAPNETFFTTSNPLLMKPRHAKDKEPNLQWEKNCVEVKGNKRACGRYSLAIIEFDDLGQLREPSQLVDARRLIETVRETLQEDLAAEHIAHDSLTVIFFTHGWKHHPTVFECTIEEEALDATGALNGLSREPAKREIDTRKCRSDLERFRHFLRRLGEGSSGSGKAYDEARRRLDRSHIVGIFLTWRGAPMRQEKPLERWLAAAPNLFSFFSRARAAGRIGGEAARYTDVIYELSGRARERMTMPCWLRPDKQELTDSTETAHLTAPAESAVTTLKLGQLSPIEIPATTENQYASIVDDDPCSTRDDATMLAMPRTSIIAIGHSMGAKMTELALGPSLVVGTKGRTGESETAILKAETLKAQANLSTCSATRAMAEAEQCRVAAAEIDARLATLKVDGDRPLADLETDKRKAEQTFAEAQEIARVQAGAVRALKAATADLEGEIAAKHRDAGQVLGRFTKTKSHFEGFLGALDLIDSASSAAPSPCREAPAEYELCSRMLHEDLLGRLSSASLCSYLRGGATCKGDESQAPTGEVSTEDTDSTSLLAGMLGIEVTQLRTFDTLTVELEATRSELGGLEGELRALNQQLAERKSNLRTAQRLANEKADEAVTSKSAFQVAVDVLADHEEAKQLQRDAAQYRSVSNQREIESRASLKHADALESQARSRAAEALPIPFDIVLLINPAAPALRARELREAFTSLPGEVKRRRYGVEKPLLVSISSKSDWATGTMFPMGQKLALLARPFQSDGKYRKDLTTIAPRRSDLLSHRICLASTKRSEEDCRSAGTCKQCESSKPDLLYRSIEGIDYGLERIQSGNETGSYWIIDEAAGLIDGHSDALSSDMIQILIGLLGTANAFEIPNPDAFLKGLNASTSQGCASQLAEATCPIDLRQEPSQAFAADRTVEAGR